MKTRTLVSIFIIVLAVLVIAGSCATSKKAYIPQENEELYGTWVNPEYEKISKLPKWVTKPDGTLEGYTTIDTDRVHAIGEYTIAEKWTDFEGNICYKYKKTSLTQVVSFPADD